MVASESTAATRIMTFRHDTKSSLRRKYLVPSSTMVAPLLQPQLPIPPSSLPVALSFNGPTALTEPLGAALRCQWAYGFPTVPRPAPQLTHGFFHYPAGMQAVAAAHMLSVLPPGVLLDPFVGGGTTLVEGLRSGRQAIGADASPLALFATAHHTWLASDAQLAGLRERATRALLAVDPVFERAVPATATDTNEEVATERRNEWRPGAPTHLKRQAKLDGGRHEDATTMATWEPLRAQVEGIGGSEGAGSGAAELSPLWFCYAAAQQRSERYRFHDPLAAFDATVDAYCDAARALRTHAPPLPAARLVLSDARSLSLQDAGLPLADAVLTSPPYAGVYDYLSHAREARARLGARGDASLMGLRGTPAGRDWPQAWRSHNEMGARKAMRKTRRGTTDSFVDTWEKDQRAWLAALRRNVRSGGRAALLIGDGEGSIDALVSTTAAAEEVGLTFLASATIVSTAERHMRRKGKRRPEHAILLEMP